MSWYFNKDLKPQGPFELEDLRAKILRGEISPFDLVLQEKSGEWKQAVEWREFERNLFPALQEVDMHPMAAQWVLLREVQEGPYTQLQIEMMLAAQEVTPKHYVWKSGLTGWVQIQDRPEFARKIFAPPEEMSRGFDDGPLGPDGTI